MKSIELPPDPHLLESMRAVGYTAETATADIIDNALAAHADRIDVMASASGPFRLSILDNGCGMNRATALDAMRLAAHSPSAERSANDLGRFGLGLKTASLSQCRSLTVATRRDGSTTVLRWSLDHVSKSGKWQVLELQPNDAAPLLGWDQFDQQTSGTLVAWEDLDLLSKTEGGEQSDFDEAVTRVRSHCELVFHRYAIGDGVPRVSISFNGSPVAELDPFLRTAKATQHKQQVIRVNGLDLPVHAYTLPYINKMTASQRTSAMSHGGLRDSQGFYIYRAGRLVIWGTWFRLNPKNEMGKLARVQVDIPNTLDHLWALDIKKSQATPPREIREALRNLANQMIGPSTRVQKFRGVRLSPMEREVARGWNLVLERDRAFRYVINREHPVLKQLVDELEPRQMSRLEDALSVVEVSFPVIDAHNRLSEDSQSLQDAVDVDALVEHALSLRPMFGDTHPQVDDFVDLMLGMEPYTSTPKFAERLRSTLRSRKGDVS
jgi:hypothetical protein